jgi:hypothetical protein
MQELIILTASHCLHGELQATLGNFRQQKLDNLSFFTCFNVVFQKKKYAHLVVLCCVIYTAIANNALCVEPWYLIVL